MGEGGAVSIVSKPLLKKIVEIIRDWGRERWCTSGIDNTCNKKRNGNLENYQMDMIINIHIVI